MGKEEMTEEGEVYTAENFLRVNLKKPRGRAILA
jgi:hypothetical protein